ncbi:DEFECTIVE ANTHER DEHISCENCE family protein [Dorcoceras hygrometricum]|uniref:DEFECTIVE ANTHER DEHISCENCE family protein n=1 Tax=Dorcoceras hygrometricum TaxID=472368 RepID=A0A2Z7AZA8_9LAMI|nr:DEFECTIVE ANTHER DEHISCENCE family protein [Dorcoceras hygrometricum]
MSRGKMKSVEATSFAVARWRVQISPIRRRFGLAITFRIARYLCVVRRDLCFPDFSSGSAARGKMKSGSVSACVVPEKCNAIIGVVTAGFECLPSSCDGQTGPDDHGPMISTGRLAVRGSSGNQAGSSGVPAGRSPFP